MPDRIAAAIPSPVNGSLDAVGYLVGGVDNSEAVHNSLLGEPSSPVFLLGCSIDEERGLGRHCSCSMQRLAV